MVPSTSGVSSGRPIVHPSLELAALSYNQVREEMERIQRQLMTPNQVRQLSKNAYQLSAKEYERYVMGNFDPVAMASSAPYTAGPPLEPEEERRLALYTELGIGGGEELVSIAVRKDDGSIDTRPA